MNENGEQGSGHHSQPVASVNPGDPLASVISSLSGENDNGYQTFQGLDGVPHRARGVRYLRKDDPEHLQPQTAGRIRCELFNIGNAEDKKRYEMVASLVYSMAQRGSAIITAVDRQFVNDNWTILLEWVEVFTYDTMSQRQYSQAEPGILRRR